ncbi:hypothetical protein GOP47_0004791 [Adiantum capillus-veneris]|uniref:ACB domain-containing protein n=1 Tax=Adiantum capillus-veneris TaxID=13818 RepID=A0A9D4ZML1_ADICA|nr:hypothetical protein GOP47_0004791 [Adiantum capillus-veneris]
MARSGPSYPNRFWAAAAYAGFGTQASSSSLPPRFSDETSFILYALYQQATVGPCKAPKPQSWNTLDGERWKSWHALGDMVSVEAMRLFVKILEEEDPAWLSKVQDPEPEMKESAVPEVRGVLKEGAALSIKFDPYSGPVNPPDNGVLVETEDKDVLIEGVAPNHYKWVSPQVFGRRPTPRYQHAAEIIGDKMYIVGGNHNGRYLNDVQVLDLATLTWAKVDQKSTAAASPTLPGEQSAAVMLPPCAGHSLVEWGGKLLAVAGHSKDPSDSVIVRAFDVKTNSWTFLRSFGKAPIARGGQSVTLVGSNLVMFGGEDSKRRLLNDLNILDLETMTWDDVEAVGTPPSPRSDHTATVQAGRYLLVFGGGSHSTCFNDLHVLDLDSMEWSQPQPQGVTPTPRAGHAGVKVGDSWYIIGGGDNKSGISETMVLNLSTLVWSVAASVEGRTPIASEGLSVVSATSNGEEVLVAFGGYNGRYSNELYILKTNQKVKSQPKYLESPAAAAAAASVKAAYTSQVPSANGSNGFHMQDISQENRVKEIMVDIPKSRNMGYAYEEIREQLALASKASGDLEAAVSSLQAENARLKQELGMAQSSSAELSKELHSVRGQLDNEQSRCFRLEVDLAELRQKLHSMEALQKELELLRRQKAAADQVAASAVQKQSSGGVWGWLAGAPPNGKTVET